MSKKAADGKTEVAEHSAAPRVDAEKGQDKTAHTLPDEASSETAPSNTKERSRLSRFWWIIPVVVINIGIAGGSVYLRLHHVKPKTQAATSNTLKVAQAANASAAQNAATSEPPAKPHYVSKELGIEFDYPVDWRVSEQGKNITLTSPIMSFKEASGSAQQGNLTLTLAGDMLATYTLDDNSQAVAPAEQITYANPASGQSPRTYASFFTSYNVDPTHPTLFQTVVVGGAFNYQVGQHLSDKNYKAANPFVTVYVQAYPRGQNFSPLAFTTDIWHTDPTWQQAKAILTSLRLN